MFLRLWFCHCLGKCWGNSPAEACGDGRLKTCLDFFTLTMPSSSRTVCLELLGRHHWSCVGRLFCLSRSFWLGSKLFGMSEMRLLTLQPWLYLSVKEKESLDSKGLMWIKLYSTHHEHCITYDSRCNYGVMHPGGIWVMALCITRRSRLLLQAFILVWGITSILTSVEPQGMGFYQPAGHLTA